MVLLEVAVTGAGEEEDGSGTRDDGAISILLIERKVDWESVQSVGVWFDSFIEP